jgi:hypothetical protein
VASPDILPQTAENPKQWTVKATGTTIEQEIISTDCRDSTATRRDSTATTPTTATTETHRTANIATTTTIETSHQTNTNCHTKKAIALCIPKLDTPTYNADPRWTHVFIEKATPITKCQNAIERKT